MEKLNQSTHFALPNSSFYLMPGNIDPWRDFTPQQITWSVAYRLSWLKTICGPIVCVAFNDKETKILRLILWDTRHFWQGTLSRKWKPDTLAEPNWANNPLTREKKRKKTALEGIWKCLYNRRHYWTLIMASRVYHHKITFLMEVYGK